MVMWRFFLRQNDKNGVYFLILKVIYGRPYELIFLHKKTFRDF